MFVFLKKSLLLSIIIFLQIALFSPSLLAAAPINYIGVDNDQAGISNIKERFKITNFSYFTIHQASALTNQTYDPLLIITDALTLDLYQSFQEELITNSDNTITPLAYADLLLTAGIYNCNVKIFNNTTTISLAEAISAYRQLKQQIPESRISAVIDEYNLIQEVNNQINDPQKTAMIFFNLNKYLMANPDLNIVTNGIVDISIRREKAVLTKETINKLNNWTYKISQNGNQWQGFYRDVTIIKTSPGKIALNYAPLESAASKVNKDSNSGKIGALFLFLIFTGIVMYFAYKNKRDSI